ncbi:MAG TPA: GntR family transcriptional regulator [Vicinamibacterales bacterium]|nr:GntR family transcriptional regulator [Vicinamibacterales bacterium]
MQPAAPAVRAESIADKVYALLRQEIAGGAVRPGERIQEKVLAARLGVSRTPIREALLRLEAEGVVLCNSRRSYNVRVLTVQDVREIYDTLGILEGAAAAAATPRLQPEDLEELRRLNRLMAGAAARPDLRAFGEWNRRFHDVFLLRLDNRVLRETCTLIRGRLYTFPVRRRSLAAWLRKSVAEHRAIIRLAAAGKAEALGAYFRDVHWSYERNRRFIVDAFDRDGEPAIHL